MQWQAAVLICKCWRFAVRPPAPGWKLTGNSGPRRVRATRTCTAAGPRRATCMRTRPRLALRMRACALRIHTHPRGLRALRTALHASRHTLGTGMCVVAGGYRRCSLVPMCSHSHLVATRGANTFEPVKEELRTCCSQAFEKILDPSFRIPPGALVGP